MKLLDIPKFLAFDRGAILNIARTPRATIVALLLLFTGTVARNYDGADLIHEWTMLLHGVAISTINAFFLFCLVALPLGEAAWTPVGVRTPFITFLTLFWMTTPTAWLYAIPWEQFLDPVGALRVNAWTLAFVSVWRVALITRVLQVVFDTSWRRVLFIVLAYSDILVFLGAKFGPAPIVDFMGGLRYTKEEQFLSNLNFNVLFFTFLAALPLCIAAVVAMMGLKGRWNVPAEPSRRVGWGVIVFVAASYVGAGVLLMLMQPQQQNRYRVESLLRNGHIAEAITEMSKRSRSDFPRIWDPPPRAAYRDKGPTMDEVREVLKDPAITGWARDLYLEKSWWLVRPWGNLAGLGSPSDIARFAQSRHEDPRSVLETDPYKRDALLFHATYDTRFSEEDRALLKSWIEPFESPQRAPTPTPLPPGGN